MNTKEVTEGIIFWLPIVKIVESSGLPAVVKRGRKGCEVPPVKEVASALDDQAQNTVAVAVATATDAILLWRCFILPISSLFSMYLFELREQSGRTREDPYFLF